MTTEVLHQLNDIFKDHEDAAMLEDIFMGYKRGSNVVVLMAVEEFKQIYGWDGNMNRYPINDAKVIPEELVERITKTIHEYKKEQYQKISDVQVSNLPWKNEE